MIDLDSLSIFLSDGKTNLGEELAQDQEALGEIAAGFERVTWCAGNHEERASRALGQFFGVNLLAKLLELDNIQTTNYYYILVGDNWIATHPKNTSRIPARVSAQLADKFGKNVISFHGHLTGVSQSLNGKYLAIDAGIVADPLRIEYNMVRQGTYPAMTEGGVLLIKGKDGEYHPRIYNKYTDFEIEREMGELWLKSKSPQSLVSPARKQQQRVASKSRRD